MSKKYHCSKHGNIGDPNCKECISNLRKVCKDNNALLIDDALKGQGEVRDPKLPRPGVKK